MSPDLAPEEHPALDIAADLIKQFDPVPVTVVADFTDGRRLVIVLPPYLPATSTVHVGAYRIAAGHRRIERVTVVEHGRIITRIEDDQASEPYGGPFGHADESLLAVAVTADSTEVTFRPLRRTASGSAEWLPTYRPDLALGDDKNDTIVGIIRSGFTDQERIAEDDPDLTADEELDSLISDAALEIIGDALVVSGARLAWQVDGEAVPFDEGFDHE